MKREAKFQTKFNHWLKNKQQHKFVFKLPDLGVQMPFDCFSVDKFHEFWAWELKQSQTDSLPFSALVPHQRNALLIVDGYVVIKFKSGVAIVPIDIFLLEEKRSKRKSITYERAKNLSTIIFQ